MSKFKNIILPVLLIIGIVAVGYYFLPLKKDSSFVVDIRQITGLPTKISGNQITLDGGYSAAYVPEDLQSVREISFLVDDKTMFKKQEIHFPPPPKLPPNSSTTTTITSKDLTVTDSEGSLADLEVIVSTAADKADINIGSVHIEASFPTDIHSVKLPTASEVFYKVLVHPSGTP